MDFSDEPRNVVKELPSFSKPMNHFDDDSGFDTSNDFATKMDSARNPFLASGDSPKKSSKLFQKSSEMMMSTKTNRYDVFKNEAVNGHEPNASPPQNTKSKTEVNPDLFKDFAIAAFSEFKVDKKSSMNHEFSNKLSEQKNLKNGHQMKVISKTRLCECLELTKYLTSAVTVRNQIFGQFLLLILFVLISALLSKLRFFMLNIYLSLLTRLTHILFCFIADQEWLQYRRFFFVRPGSVGKMSTS